MHQNPLQKKRSVKVIRRKYIQYPTFTDSNFIKVYVRKINYEDYLKDQKYLEGFVFRKVNETIYGGYFHYQQFDLNYLTDLGILADAVYRASNYFQPLIDLKINGNKISFTYKPSRLSKKGQDPNCRYDKLEGELNETFSANTHNACYDIKHDWVFIPIELPNPILYTIPELKEFVP